jgi:hypothetical protein
MDDKTIKSLYFTGKKEDYVMWQAKFLAYAHFKEFKTVLTGELVLCKDEKLTDIQIKNNKIFMKGNDQGYSMLNLCVKDSISFGAIYNAISEEYPKMHIKHGKTSKQFLSQ